MIHLLVVGSLYLLSGIWCTWQPDLASDYLGFELLSGVARSEFLSVYGGLQCGLAIAMILSALRSSYIEAALFFALVFSVVLQAFRAASLLIMAWLPEVIQMLILEAVIVLILTHGLWRIRRQPRT